MTLETSARAGAGTLLTAALAIVAASALWLAPDEARAAPRVDRWSEGDRSTLASMLLSRLPAPPADPSNAVEARPEAGARGPRLFSDTRLSRNGQVSCASCHAPERDFQDGLPVGKGVGTGSRRTMPIAAATHGPWLFWDGRKDSLWSQALGPLEDSAEHGANRTQLVRLLQTHYRADYERVFGPLPSLQGVPAHAGPLGTDDERQAWARLSGEQRDAINRAFANLGKSIAAYERTVAYGESRFDRYAAAALSGDRAGQQVLSSQEVGGLRLFIGKAQCSTCHNGPLLTDQHFHNTGVPQRDPARPDRGRSVAVAKVQQDEFNCLGKYSDAGRDACQELRFIAADDPGMEGAFKTPSLRNVAERGPYMHAGQFASLEEVVAHYVRSPKAALGHSELAHAGKGHAERAPIRLTDEEAAALVAFLKTLNGPSR
jgi:cytochrome c peroxidase